jgi:PqqD family protein of HPr-rel-A system
MTISPIWRVAPGQRLDYRCWDGECLLYNDLSGDTHLLDEFAIALLEQLQAAAQSAAQLAALLDLPPHPDEAAATPLPSCDDALSSRELVDAVLADLAALHLVDAPAC